MRVYTFFVKHGYHSLMRTLFMSFVHKIETLLEEENEDLNQDIILKNNTNSYNLNSLIKKIIEDYIPKRTHGSCS